MKALTPWLVFFLVALGFAFLIDEPTNIANLPSEAIRVLLALNLTLFVYLLARLVGRPIGAYLVSRQEGIAQELDEARSKLAEAETLRLEVRERLDKVEQEVVELRERAESAGRAEAEEITSRAAEEEARFLKRIENEINRRQIEARQALAHDTAELTAQLTRELLATELTDDDRQRILDRSLGALQSLHGEE